MEYGNQFSATKTFYDWCIENNKQIYLDNWNYELNKSTPQEIGYASNKKYWFNCPKSIHKPFQKTISFLTNKKKENVKEKLFCNACESVGQYIIDTYGEDNFNKVWSDKNTKDPFGILKGSEQKIWIKCINDNTHPDYEQVCNTFCKGIGCPYCTGHKVCLTNSLGYLYPESLKYWSDKNNKTPYDYTCGSNYKAWWKCPDNKHEDFQRKICASIGYDFRCKKCSDAKVDHSGPNNHFWKGGITPKNKCARKTSEYFKWRTNVFEKDDFTCQCCGQRGGKLQAHHLRSFSKYKELRYDIDNGITLCFDHHDTTIKGSFHNTYGTSNNTTEQLEEYINNKRKELGINISFSINEYKNGNILKPKAVDNNNETSNNKNIDNNNKNTYKSV